MSGSDLLRRGFFLLLVRPFLKLFIGIRVEGAENLPAEDPFLLVANHNSHLDTPLLLSLFPVGRLARIRPVAAADYWLSSAVRRFVARTFFNILPIDRRKTGPGGGDALAPMREALARGESLVLFPEGTRGDPEVMSRFHSGAARLAVERPEVPVVPVHLKNAGRTLPRGDGLLVPFICELRVGPAIRAQGSAKETQDAMEDAVRRLGADEAAAPAASEER